MEYFILICFTSSVEQRLIQLSRQTEQNHRFKVGIEQLVFSRIVYLPDDLICRVNPSARRGALIVAYLE